MLDYPRRTAEPARTLVVCLEYRIVEDVHVAGHPLFAARVTHLEERPMGHVPTAARRAVAAPRDVPPGVERADGRRGVGYGDQHVLYVVVPYPDVLVAALRLDSIVPAVGDVVTVDVAVGAWETAEAAVVSGAHPIVKVMVLVGPALVVANYVIAFGLPEDHRLRSRGVGGLTVFLGPTVGVPGGVVQFAALNNHGAQVPLVAEDAGLIVLAPALLALASPLADVAVFDDDVVATEEPDPVLGHVFDGEPT